MLLEMNYKVDNVINAMRIIPVSTPKISFFLQSKSYADDSVVMVYDRMYHPCRDETRRMEEEMLKRQLQKQLLIRR